MLARNPAKYFIRKDVQQILISLTGCDINKIFAPGFNPAKKQSQIELLTDEQLKQANEKTLIKARRLLQMPPFLPSRPKVEKILANDEQLNPLNLTSTNYVFTDISLNVPDKNRMVVVRESNGILRHADHEEREKMLNIYLHHDRPNYTPKMFDPINLEDCLKLKSYLILLNKACLTFEPNDPDFNRITHRVYEYINETGDYEILHSTRFYGPMVFYLAWFKKMEKIVAFMLEKSKIDECAELVCLYNIVHDIKVDKVYSTKLNLIKNFVKKELKDNEACKEALTKINELNPNAPQNKNNKK